MDLLLEELGLGLEVEVDQEALDGLRAHAALEVVAEPLPQRPVDRIVGDQLLDREVLERRQHVVQVLGLLPGGLRDLLDVALGLPASRRELRALGPLALEVAQAVLQLREPLGDRLVPLAVDLALLGVEVTLDLREILVSPLHVHPGDDVGREVDDLLEVLRGQVEQVPEAAGDALEVPDVRDGRRELDVAHAVAADLRAGHLDAAALTDDALEPDALVLPAVALPVAGGTEDPLAEQAVLLRLQRPVVDGLRLLHLAVRPGPDLIRRGQPDPQLIEVVDVKHGSRSPLSPSLVYC